MHRNQFCDVGLPQVRPNGFELPRLTVIESIGDDPQSECIGAIDGFRTGLSVCQNARKLRHLGQPAAIFFLFDFNR